MTPRRTPVPVAVDDAGFVRVPEAHCYPVLTDVAAWPRFWPATEVVDHGRDRLSLTAGTWPRRLLVEVTAGSWRHDAGFTMTLGRDLEGTWEVWLEPGFGGTVVHHVVAARARRGWAPGTFRRWLRRGTWALKDELEHAARRDVAEGACRPGDRAVTDPLRCDACGARNRSDASWCTQCYEALAAVQEPVTVRVGPTSPPQVPLQGASPGPPPGPPPAAPPAPSPAGRVPAAPSGDGLLPLPGEVAAPAASPDDEPVPLTSGDGRFRSVEDGLEWRCEVCQEWNVIERTSCTVCGAAFMRSDEEEVVRAVAPPLLLAATVVLPGTGHALLGQWGQAFFRWVLAVVWGGGGLSLLLAAIASGQPALPAVPLLLGWLVLVGTSMNDVLVARGASGRVLLRGRLLLWLVLGVVGATVAGAFLSAFSTIGG